MIEPTEADIGRKVAYTGKGYSGGKREEGVITSLHAFFVLVQYGSDAGSKLTHPHDLQWFADAPEDAAA